MDFEQALSDLGFRAAEERASRGSKQYRYDPNPYLTHWVHVYDDGSALYTWEFAIVDFLAAHEIQLGSGEALNLFMFPVRDDRGPQDGAWLAGALDRTEQTLRSLRFDAPGDSEGS